MGYRAHTITRHRDYGSTTFSDWTEFDTHFISTLRDAGVDVHDDESGSFYEVQKEELQKYVKSLPVNEEPSVAYPDYTNVELIEELQTAIDESKGDWVSWEWF